MSYTGGMSPELMKALASDPEIIRMLRDPKMQDIMSAVMTGGPKAMQKVCAMYFNSLFIFVFKTDFTVFLSTSI